MIVKHKRYDIIMAIEAEMFRLLFCAIKGVTMERWKDIMFSMHLC